jgi:hypothetical protein
MPSRLTERYLVGNMRFEFRPQNAYLYTSYYFEIDSSHYPSYSPPTFCINVAGQSKRKIYLSQCTTVDSKVFLKLFEIRSILDRPAVLNMHFKVI